MIKYLITFLFTIVLFGWVHGQVSNQYSQEDKRLIGVTMKHDDVQTKIKRFGLFKFYKSAISPQIINDCIYDESCSLFSKNAFHEFGLVKGFLLTVDRLTRCNQVSKSQFTEVRIDETHKVIDHAEDY